MSCVSPTSENLCINGCCWCPPRFEFVRWKLPCPVVHLWRQLSYMEREQQKSKAILFPWVNIFWLKLRVACSSSNSKIVNCLECIVPYGEIALACSHIFPPSHSQIPINTLYFILVFPCFHCNTTLPFFKPWRTVYSQPLFVLLNMELAKPKTIRLVW